MGSSGDKSYHIVQSVLCNSSSELQVQPIVHCSGPTSARGDALKLITEVSSGHWAAVALQSIYPCQTPSPSQSRAAPSCLPLCGQSCLRLLPPPPLAAPNAVWAFLGCRSPSSLLADRDARRTPSSSWGQPPQPFGRHLRLTSDIHALLGKRWIFTVCEDFEEEPLHKLTLISWCCLEQRYCHTPGVADRCPECSVVLPQAEQCQEHGHKHVGIGANGRN